MKPSGLNTPTFLDDDDDQDNDSSVSSSSSFDQSGFLESLGSVAEGPGDGHASSSASDSAAADDQPQALAVADGAGDAAEEATMPELDVVVDLSVPGPSMSSEVQHSYQLRSRIPRPPNAFMLFAQERRRSVAAENPNENNQRVSSRLGKLWRSLSAAEKEPYLRKAAEAAAVHRRKYPGYVYNPREARRRKEQERRAKAVASKMDGSGDHEPSASTAATQDRSSPDFQQLPHSLPPPQRNRRRAASAARSSGAGQATPTRPTATVSATAAARSAAQPYSVHRFSGPLAPSLRGAPVRGGTASAAQSAAAHPFSQPSPLVACGRDCAAVPHPQMNGSGLPHAADGSARQLGWFFDTAQAPAAHVTLGVAATPVLCWPLLATAGPSTLTPSLPLLLPTAVTPAVARHHFAVPGPPMPPTRHEATAGPDSMQFFSAMQHEQQRNSINATRSTLNGTAIATTASRQQQQTATPHRGPARAAASSAAAALWPPAAGQPAQRRDAGGPFQQCAFAASGHEMAGTAVACPYAAQVCCAGAGAQGFGAQPYGALLGASSGHGGGAILMGTPTLFPEPAASGSTHSRGRPAADRYHSLPLVQQEPVQQQQQQQQQQPQVAAARQPQPSQLGVNLAGWHQMSAPWGGPFGPDVDLAMQMMIGRSAPQRQHSTTPTYTAASGNAPPFRRPT
ncbi:uncharacterized protein LOC142585092 isoform X1 [Dermacentor variabilis]|uniref:uncharacterized protein LOC142585092 isoform X1 n=2 Tax=Dermacentor variabilis TaxID=34621 RepID=UPI003F5ADF1D